MEIQESTIQQALASLEIEMRAHGDQVDCPLRHTFTPGLYTREITMPAGIVVVSEKHLTEHPYVISKGKVHVFIEGEGWNCLTAPHSGVTKPGTKRLLYVEEETIWTTFHPTDKTTVEEVKADIIDCKTLKEETI